MSKKHKKVWTTLNYIEHFLILGSTIAGCISISAFASLVGIPIGITNSPIGLIGSILISKSLIDSNISHDELILINVLRKYDDMKEEIKYLKA